MKRALAERAKQSAGLSSNGTVLPVQRRHRRLDVPSHSTSSSAQDTHHRPLKVPRRCADGVGSTSSSETQQQSQLPLVVSSGSENPKRNSSSTTTTTDPGSSGSASNSRQAPGKNSSSSSSSLKRQRASSAVCSSNNDDEDEDNPNFSAFYLKHQNQALASELKSYQYRMYRLERERDYRRKQCKMACQALNSIQATWTQMETALHDHQHYQQQTGSFQKQPIIMQPRQQNSQQRQQTSLSAGAPMSTGNGRSVELIGALFENLAELATNHPNYSQSCDEDGEDNEDQTTSRRLAQDGIDPAEKQQLDDLSCISWNVLQRANTLEQWIWSLLQKLVAASSSSSKIAKSEQGTEFRSENRLLTSEVAELKGLCREYRVKIEELSKARDDITASDRKVRRSIYRLAAGRVKIDEVVKDLEKSDEDGNLAAEARMEAQMEALKKEAAEAAAFKVSIKKEELDGDNNNKHVEGESTEISDKLRRQIADLEKAVASREELLRDNKTKLISKEERINELVMKELSEDDAKKLKEYEKISKKLQAVEDELKETKKKLEKLKERWSREIGDKEVAMKAVEELQKKHRKRWADFSGELVGDTSASDKTSSGVDIDSGLVPVEEQIKQAKTIIELDHKLRQALENVRQADIVRQNLKEALIMNESLQAKLDEFKVKYAAIQAGRGSNSSVSKSQSDQNTSSYSSSSKDRSANEKGDSTKLHRENRRLKKEIAALSASKDGAKSKLERTEKQRDALVETNTRLLKQSAEKDDMNAKSLSTILHLKSLTEQLNLQKSNLEKQAKSAKQLALAARLATNAKDRVAEEVQKEKQILESNLDEAERKNSKLRTELDTRNNEFSEADAKISSLNSKLRKSLKRSNELVADCSKNDEEKLKLKDALESALRKAVDAESKVSELSKELAGKDTDGTGNSSSTSNFTVDQLNTQVSVLKGRLECPVCHYRDKNCIILRCRHMFCKNCVEENIQNRSRKCPSCGGKFSERDVEDVWL